MANQTLPEKYTEIRKLIVGMDRHELNGVIKLVNAEDSENQRRVGLMFKVGDKVQFDSKRHGVKVEGTILKLHKVSALVKTNGDIGRWKVSLSMLSKVE